MEEENVKPNCTKSADLAFTFSNLQYCPELFLICTLLAYSSLFIRGKSLIFSANLAPPQRPRHSLNCSPAQELVRELTVPTQRVCHLMAWRVVLCSCSFYPSNVAPHCLLSRGIVSLTPGFWHSQWCLTYGSFLTSLLLRGKKLEWPVSPSWYHFSSYLRQHPEDRARSFTVQEGPHPSTLSFHFTSRRKQRAIISGPQCWGKEVWERWQN